MKKVIALALVLLMALSMTTVAFAADFATHPGDSFTVDPDDFFCDASNSTNKVITNSLTALFGGTGSKEAEKYFTEDNFKIVLKFGKGADLVESYKFDGGKIKITLKKSALEAPSLPNVEVKEFYVVAKKDVKQVASAGTASIKRNEKFNFSMARDGKTGSFFATIGWTLLPAVDNKVEFDLDDTTTTIFSSGLYKFTPDVKATGSFKFGAEAYGEVNVFKNDKYFAGFDTDPNMDIIKANPDADVRFVNLMGSFNQNMALELYADEDQFVYEIKDGKLVKSSLKWDKDVYAWTGKVRTLGTYVISDIELKDAVKAEDETKNPNTGANDVVGVAVALAVVSLVAAGAVSIKK